MSISPPTQLGMSQQVMDGRVEVNTAHNSLTKEEVVIITIACNIGKHTITLTKEEALAFSNAFAMKTSQIRRSTKQLKVVPSDRCPSCNAVSSVPSIYCIKCEEYWELLLPS